METKNESNSRSLPPLVEGKVHGYLRLVIDEIVWCRRSPGDVTVLASWWGELDSAQFRPADIKSGDNRQDSDITETYTIRTNLDLFEEYLKNCETLELVIISETTHQVVGTAQVSDLCNLLSGKSYFQYVPILNDSGSRIGDIHATMKLLNVPKTRNSPSKSEVFKKKLENKILADDPNIFQNYSTYRSETKSQTKTSFPYENDVPVAIKNAKQNENIYRSILKERRLDSGNSLSGVNDNLVAQVVARAQRLRGAILKESRDEDPLALSEGSTIDSFNSEKSVDKEATLYEYFLGKKMTRYEEKKALEALRSTSPTPSLIDLASETIRTCRTEKNAPTSTERFPRASKPIEDFSPPETASLQPKELQPIDYVDSLRIAVESLTLTSAGYRRVRSSCLSRGDGIPISVTYFVQYDAMFGSIKKVNRKIINESKPVKLCSKKQVGQVIYFNHEAVYDLPKTYLHMDMPLKFKIFNRHLNQRTPTELGVGSMYVGDAARVNTLSSTQRLAIVNKGIKIGELKVTAELGCDKIHFGKQFVEAVTSAKENIPVLEVSSASSLATERYRTATGNEDKPPGKSNSAAGNRAESSWSGNNSARTSKQENQRRLQQNSAENRDAEAEDPRRDLEEKVLLHGLIYVAEGKDLGSMSTYLICRAFWREDRAASRICDDTTSPFYHFHQLVPLIHGPDLLERTKDNCIVIEVYSRNSSGVDSLLGISKLPVHQLYVAYRDPQVLPHLLRSKYPVISVDGWVSISDPVTGRPCGQLLALVALGTADQIALLEMTRGLRDSSVTPRTIRNFAWNAAENTNCMSNEPERRSAENEALPVRETRQGSYEASRASRRTNEENYGLGNFHNDPERNADDRNVKTQECQTEITTVKYFKPHGVEEELANENPQSQVLNAIVDRLAQALNVPKQSADQAAQTETDFRIRDSNSKGIKPRDVEPLNLGTSPNNSFSEDSDGSQRDNFHLSTEIYRSVGVGAEFDDAGNQGPSTSYATADSMSVSGFEGRTQVSNLRATNLPDRKGIERNSGAVGFNDRMQTAISSPRLLTSGRNERLESEPSDVEVSAFRAVVEIDCALHLPKVEKNEETVEPCTYVTFQKARSSGESQYGSYVVTNLCPFSCSPKWDWRCDTKLSNDLLENEEKRLILKVWRLVDPETSMQIDLERDIVIGFSAIDVSVLTVGFPVVSGWFHVMDFTGKCNGQIKVSVTPLDNVGALGKSTCASNTARPPLPDFDHSNFSSPYPADLQNNANPSGDLNSVRSNVEEVVTSGNQVDNEPMLDIGLGLGDASMSFLSLSLKQKLTELDEIKKRLQSRLHDVTNTAFDDDFDNDFDMPIADPDRDNLENGNSTEDSRNVLRDLENWQIPHPLPSNPNSTNRSTMPNGNRCNFDSENRRVTSNSNSVSLDANFTDTGYSTSSNVHSSHTVSNGNRCSSETEDNRLRSRLLSEENLNGFETVSAFPGSPNLLNGHYESTQTNPRNRSEVQNPRNYRSLDSAVDFRGQSVGNSATEDLSNGSEDPPIRGTRMHISHLLDKLTTQLTSVPPPTTNQPMKRNIMDLITSLRRNNNNFPNDVKCNREVNVRTVPTQTETNYVRDARISHLANNSTETRENATSNDQERDRDDAEIPAKAKRRNKVSTAIREELAADEANETQDFDELSAHLMTSNVRHMNLESILNPLLYSHLIPDVQTTENGAATLNSVNSGNSRNSPGNTPEVEAIERLDTRYTENFNATINNGLSRLRNLIDAENASRQGRSGTARSENDEVFRITPSGVSENIDGNIDVTVIHKPCNDDLMASNSVDSTTTISLDQDMAGTEIDDNSSLNSTETSVSAVSRQAPDGGNPVEEIGAPLVLKRADDSQDSSSGS